MTNEQKFSQIKLTGKLPSPQGVALKVLTLAQKPDVSIAELSHVIHADPALVGQLIKFANSIRYSPQVPVTGIHAAATMIGTNNLRNLVLSLSLLANYRRGPCREFDYEKYWTRSVSRALALQAIMHYCPVLQPEEAFSLGLLAHIGQLALATVFPDEYSRMLRHRHLSLAKNITDYEREIFHISSDELTQCIFTDWGLPTSFIRAVELAQLASSTSYLHQDGKIIGQMLDFAHYFSRWLMSGHHNSSSSAVYSRQNVAISLIGYIELLKINDENVNILCQRILRERKEWASLLQEQPREKIARRNSHTSPSPEDTPAPLRLLIYADKETTPSFLPLLRHTSHTILQAPTLEQVLPMALNHLPHGVFLQWSTASETLARYLREIEALEDLALIGFGEELPPELGHVVDGWLPSPCNDTTLKTILDQTSRRATAKERLSLRQEQLEQQLLQKDIAGYESSRQSWFDLYSHLPTLNYADWRIKKLRDWMLLCDRTSILVKVHLPGARNLIHSYGVNTWHQALNQIHNDFLKQVRSCDEFCMLDIDTFLCICPDRDDLEVVRKNLRALVPHFTIYVDSLVLNLKVEIRAELVDGTMSEETWLSLPTSSDVLPS